MQDIDLFDLFPLNWRDFLPDSKNILHKIDDCLAKENGVIFPERRLIFNSFYLTDCRNVKVVILGQDPYHKINQANGLAFSVNKNQRIPPSLGRIFKELNNSIAEFELPLHGDLTNWAKQNVLLLNSFLTVRENCPTSHQKIGWQNLTDQIIVSLSRHHNNLVFLLWGKFAQNKQALIDVNKHLILTANHPSPLANCKKEGFLGCGHFLKTNQYLQAIGKTAINWQI